MKKLFILFTALAIILSDVMCATVAAIYTDVYWGMKYAGYSAGPDVAFVIAIPFLIAIVICVILAVVFYRKSKVIKAV